MINDKILVSILVPIRNEEGYIRRCLGGLSNQTWKHIEILVIDGCSTDQTRHIVQEQINQDSRFHLLDNPQQTAPWAMNHGLKAAKGTVIVRIDGHCEVEPDYVERCLGILNTTRADCVGGALRNVGETFWASVIALGMGSPFGVGNARFRYTEQAGEVDTLAFGAYRREVFERIGFFDTTLTRNQDDEFNYRLRAAGGKIWLDPSIRAVYYTRSTLKHLWWQYFQYGWWKVLVIRKHPGSAQLRHLVPAGFVLVWLVSVALALIGLDGGLALALLGSIYGSACLWFATRLKPTNLASFLALLVVFPTLHLAYGCGFWSGLFSWLLGRMPLNQLPTAPPK